MTQSDRSVATFTLTPVDPMLCPACKACVRYMSDHGYGPETHHLPSRLFGWQSYRWATS